MIEPSGTRADAEQATRLEGAPSLPVRIGNDIVDLRHPRCRDRGARDRLPGRVLVEAERRWMEAGSDSVRRLRRLWALWAAKETAFKIRSKRARAPGAFLHRTFVAELEEEDAPYAGAVRMRGRVRGPGLCEPVEVDGWASKGYLHLVGWDGPLDDFRLYTGLEGEEFAASGAGAEGAGSGGRTEDSLEELKGRFTKSEWEGVYSLPSARVRLLARERIAAHLSLLPEMNEAGGRVELLTSGTRPGRTPPRIRIGGRDRPDLDVSLSHHGRFVAWAILLPHPRRS